MYKHNFIQFNPVKYLILLLIVTSSLGVRSQSNIADITTKAKAINLPFSDKNEWIRQWSINSEKQPKLNAIDRKHLLNALSKATQLIVNPKGGTAFGNLDWPDSSDTFLDNVDEIALLGVIKQNNSKKSLIYIKAQRTDDTLWYGILVACDNNSQITNWMFSDGDANGGNPHGDINRNFIILPTGIIKINEDAWGDNTDTYGFTGTFKVINSKLVLQQRKFSRGLVLQ